MPMDHLWQAIHREGQWAVFVNEGRITDSFGPGRHVLASRTLRQLWRVRE